MPLQSTNLLDPVCCKQTSFQFPQRQAAKTHMNGKHERQSIDLQHGFISVQFKVTLQADGSNVLSWNSL